VDSYVTGSIIKTLRLKKGLTQKELADRINISEKAISKWETGKGLPDISLLESLAKALDISVVELFNGEEIINSNKTANMLKLKFYVCPICGNVITSIGEGVFSCCGNNLIIQEAEVDDDLGIEKMDGGLFVHKKYEMTKENYISFFAYVSSDKFQFVKMYPEQNAEVMFRSVGHGIIYYYNNKEGLFKKRI